MSPLVALYLRELRLSVRIGGGALMGVLFYLIVVTIFPFAIGPDLNLLSRLGPAILWIGALLATLLGLETGGAQWILGIQVAQVQAGHAQALVPITFTQGIGHAAQGELRRAERHFRAPTLWQT